MKGSGGSRGCKFVRLMRHDVVEEEGEGVESYCADWVEIGGCVGGMQVWEEEPEGVYLWESPGGCEGRDLKANGVIRSGLWRSVLLSFRLWL